jgi:hypothetical protein
VTNNIRETVLAPAIGDRVRLRRRKYGSGNDHLDKRGAVQVLHLVLAAFTARGSP